MEIVSVIVPVYYGNKYLENIKKMMDHNQQYLSIDGKYELEVIIVNDSPDVEIISPDVSWYVLNNQKNVGIHQSRINGLKQARGTYILFLDQDDTIAENYFFTQLKYIQSADAVVCNGYWKNNQVIYDQMPDVVTDIWTKAGSPMASPGQVLLRKNSIPQEWENNVMHCSGADDYLLWILMALHQARFVLNGQKLYRHVETGENASRNWKKMADSDREIRHIVQSLQIDEEKKEKLGTLLSNEIGFFDEYVFLEEGLKYMASHTNSVKSYMHHKENKRAIIIYGYGLFGMQLHKCLLQSEIDVRYIIDQHAERFMNADLFKTSDEDNLDIDEQDLIIITPLRYVDDIRKQLYEMGIKNTCSIKDFVKDVICGE